MNITIIDNYDSFTYNLSHLVKALGANVTETTSSGCHSWSRPTKLFCLQGQEFPKKRACSWT